MAACTERGQRVLIAETQQRKREKDPYHKDHFTYGAERDVYGCPQGERLHYRGREQHQNGYSVRVYQAAGAVCCACSAFGVCTKSRRGRRLKVGAYEELLQRHRALMGSPAAPALYGRRKTLIEPVFGMIKEQQGARRFLLRGLAKVRDEWSLLATGLNLKMLHRVWQSFLKEG